MGGVWGGGATFATSVGIRSQSMYRYLTFIYYTLLQGQKYYEYHASSPSAYIYCVHNQTSVLGRLLPLPSPEMRGCGLRMRH